MLKKKKKGLSTKNSLKSNMGLKGGSLSSPSSYLKNESGNLLIQLDRIISKYIRLNGSDEHGNCKCFTCNVTLDWKQMHCGHFMSRTHYPTRFELDNLHPQCPKCNMDLNGNLIVYENKLGEVVIKKLLAIKEGLTNHQLKNKINEYTGHVERLRACIRKT